MPMGDDEAPAIDMGLPGEMAEDETSDAADDTERMLAEMEAAIAPEEAPLAWDEEASEAAPLDWSAELESPLDEDPA